MIQLEALNAGYPSPLVDVVGHQGVPVSVSDTEENSCIYFRL